MTGKDEYKNDKIIQEEKTADAENDQKSGGSFNDDAPYRLWLLQHQSKCIYNKTKRQLMEVFGSAKKLYEASEQEIRGCGIVNEIQAEEFLLKRNVYDIQKAYDNFQKGVLDFTTIEDDKYPAVLRTVPDAPYGLYFRGSIPKEVSDGSARMVSIVGARNCSAYGRLMAEEIAGTLARAGYMIVSGMARGIDAAAHTGCLSSGGTTLAVLGSGADVCYPNESWEIYDRIQEKGCIFSEQNPGAAPLAQYFPARNRIISGLASVTIVVEARLKSGSLITADFALEQGRDVYAVPGRLTDPMSAGTNQLIRQGAYICTGAKTLLEDLDSSAGIGRFHSYLIEETQSNLEKCDSLVYHCLDFYPQGLEYIQKKSGLDLLSVLSALVNLSEMGLAKECFKNQYIKVR